MKIKTMTTKYFTFDYDNEAPEKAFDYEIEIKRKLNRKEKKAGKVAEIIGTVIFASPDDFKCTDMSINIGVELSAAEANDLFTHLTAFISSKSIVFIRTDKLKEGSIQSALNNIGYGDDVDGDEDITNITHIIYEEPLVGWSWIYAMLGITMGLLFDSNWGMLVGIVAGFLIGRGVEEPEKKARKELINKRREANGKVSYSVEAVGENDDELDDEDDENVQ